MHDPETLLTNRVEVDASDPAFLSALRKCFSLVQRIFGMTFNSARAVDKYLDPDWRDLRVTLEQGGVIVIAILNRDGSWLMWKEDLKSRQATSYGASDDVMRAGYRVDPRGIVTERNFTRSGRLVLTEDEASKIDLGPCDPDL